MTENLDQFVKAYNSTFTHQFDNSLILPGYAQRITDILSTTSSILELGIGHGYSTNIFLDYFTDYTVLDGSKAVIERYKKNHPHSKAKIIHTYFENYESNFLFDAIIMGFVLEHVDDPKSILEKYRKYLKTNGSIFVAVPNAKSLHRRVGQEAGLLPDIFQLSPADKELGHQRYYDTTTLSEVLNEYGYKVVRKEGILLKPLTTNQMLSLDLSQEILQAFCKVAIDYPELSAALLFEAKPI